MRSFGNWKLPERLANKNKYQGFGITGEAPNKIEKWREKCNKRRKKAKMAKLARKKNRGK
jgi:hypothetical protein